MSLFILLSAILLQGGLQPVSPRSILLFGHNAHPMIQQQWLLFRNDSSGLAERDVQIKRVAAGNFLYKKYAVPLTDPFTIILEGRDGGEKYRSNQLTPVTHLFALIDAMPMRQAEMRKKKKNQP